MNYPETDALSIGELLKSNGYKVDYLLGSKATQRAIRTALDQCSERGGNRGVVVLGVFGHGIEFETTSKSYFVPYDVRMKATRDKDGKLQFMPDGSPMMAPAADKMVSIDELLVALRESRAKNRVLLADCCRDDPNRARFRSFGSGLKQNELPKDAAVFFACSEHERAYEHKDWGHGAFTKCILDMLTQGKSLMGSLAEEVAPAVDELSAAKRGPNDPAQTPRFLATGARIDLMLNVKPMPANFTPQLDSLRTMAFRNSPSNTANALKIVENLQGLANDDPEFLFLQFLVSPPEQRPALLAKLKTNHPSSYFAMAAELHFLYMSENNRDFGKSDYDREVALMDRLIELNPDYPYSIDASQEVLSWSSFATASSRDRCLKYMMARVEKHPNDARLQHAIADELQNTDPVAALKYHAKAIELAPLEAGFHNLRGHCYMSLEKYDEAIQDFDFALTIDASYTNAAMQKTNCLLMKNLVKEAKAYFETYLKDRKLESNDYIYAGGIYYDIGDSENALKSLGKAIETDSKNVYAYAVMARLLIQELKADDLAKLLKSVRSNLSESKALSVEILICAESGALKRVLELGRQSGEGLIGGALNSIVRTSFAVGDPSLCNAILAKHCFNSFSANEIHELFQAFRERPSYSIKTAAGETGTLYLLTGKGVEKVAPGESVSLPSGHFFEEDTNFISGKLPASPPCICYFTGDKTLLGEDRWAIATPKPGIQEIEFKTIQANGKTVWVTK